MSRKQSKRARFYAAQRWRRRSRTTITQFGVDLLLYGTSFSVMQDGEIRRIDPTSVWITPPVNGHVQFVEEPPMTRLQLRDYWERRWHKIVASNTMSSRAGANLDANRVPKAAAELKPVFKELSGEGTR